MRVQGPLRVFIISPGKRSGEQVYRTLRTYFAQPVQRGFFDIGLAIKDKKNAGELPVGADVGEFLKVGAWLIGGLVFIKEAPEAMRLLGEVLNDVRTEQVIVCATLYEDLVQRILDISGRHCLSSIQVQTKEPQVEEETTRKSRHYAQENAKEHLRNGKEMQRLLNAYDKASKRRDLERAEAIRKRMGDLEQNDDKLMEKSIVLIVT